MTFNDFLLIAHGWRPIIPKHRTDDAKMGAEIPILAWQPPGSDERVHAEHAIDRVLANPNPNMVIVVDTKAPGFDGATFFTDQVTEHTKAEQATKEPA